MTSRSLAQRNSSKRNWVARFWNKVERIPWSGCWIWMGACSGGYGHVRLNRELKLAHRLCFEMHRGPIPDGLELDHLCRVPCCVNPSHLEAVTSSENTRRGRNPEVTRARYAQITHCPKGHPYAGENLRVTGSGNRYCLTCRRESKRAQRAIHRF
jgi:hypothetical protein